MLQALIPEWQQALADEIEAVKKKGSSASNTRVRNGQLLRQDGGFSVYQFTLDNPLNVPDDAPVRVKVGSDTWDGYIVATTQFEVTVAVEAHLGSVVAEATLITDTTFLLQALKDQWGKVAAGELHLNEDLVLKLLALKRPTTGRQKASPLSPPRVGQSPNTDQQQAVSASLGNEITFLWGPPGTGKTTTLAWIAEAFLSRGASVLVAAHTNVAVDKAILDTAEVLRNSYDPSVCTDFLHGRVFRFGTPQLEAVCPACKDPGREQHSEICVTGIVQKRCEELHAEKTKLAGQRAAAVIKLEKLREDIALLQRIQGLTAEVHACGTHLTAVEAKLATLVERRDLLADSIRGLGEKLQAAEQAGTLKRLFLRLDPKQLREQRDKLSQEHRTAREAVSIAQTQESEANDHRGAAEASLKTARAAAAGRWGTRMPDEGSLQRDASDTETVVSEIDCRLAEVEQRLAATEDEVLREARLIATTLTKAYINKTVASRQFDVVIVDEASMAAIPALCFAAGLAANRMVVVGDFRQLAPIAIADDELDTQGFVAKWLQRDVFDHAGIIRAVDQGTSDPRLAALTAQYRMHPSISAIPNEIVYRDLWKDQPAATYRGLDTCPFSGQPLVLVDTSDVNPWCSHDPNYSRFNLYSAVVAAHLAREVIDGDPSGTVTVGVTTPYAIQAKLIGRILQGWNLPLDRCQVLNVHKFQGSERDVMIFDLADGPQLGVGKPLKGGFGSDAMRLVNVAITRPKSKLLVVANQHYYRSKLDEDWTLRAVLDRLAEEALTVDSREIVCSYFHPDVAAAGAAVRPTAVRAELSDITVVDEKQFHDLFGADLAEAQKSVVIFSPFTARRRIEKLVDTLRVLVDGGRKVFIVTRPAPQQMSLFQDEAEEALEHLASAGVVVIRTSRKMHEKIALVDDRIVWCGSLNPLSHNDTTEMMLRFDSAAFARDVKRLWGVDDLISPYENKDEREANRRAFEEFLQAAQGQVRAEGCGHVLTVKYRRRDGAPFLACACEKSATSIPRKFLQQFVAELGMNCAKAECSRCNGTGCRGRISARSGAQGRVFLGCDHYPDCRHSLPFSRLF